MIRWLPSVLMLTLTLSLFAYSPATYAGSDGWDFAPDAIHPVSTLSWSKPDQTLLYRSCGCADACWEARLYSKQEVHANSVKGKPLASLRCDCKAMHAKRVTDKAEAPYAGSCATFSADNKMDLIRQEMEKISQPTAK